MDKKFKVFYLLLLLCLSGFQTCNAQLRESKIHPVGGPCEGCQAIYEYGNRELFPVDTLPGFESNEPKLRISGVVFAKDGKTPAENVILYIYHTNREGIYQTNGTETGWDKRHGFIRAWVKTGKDGRYAFYTFRPAPYQDGSEPEHIHLTVKEPGINPYYLDDFFFEDDPLLSPEKISNLENRGGSGIVKPVWNDGILTVHRDIVLGKNIPGYE